MLFDAKRLNHPRGHLGANSRGLWEPCITWGCWLDHRKGQFYGGFTWDRIWWLYKDGCMHQCSSLLNCLISYYYWGQHLAAEQGMGCFQTKTPEMFYLCCTSNSHMHYLLSMVKTLPSVLWCCWLGSRKGIWPVKNWVVGCWCGYLSGTRCRLAESWCHCHSLSLASVQSRLVLPFWYRLTWVVPEKSR